MYIKLYQINPKRDLQRVRFESYRLLQEVHGDDPVDSRIYDLVWEGELDAADLEEVYAILNNDVPEDFTARSLSVSDVIAEVLPGSPIAPDYSFHYCDSVGFQPIIFEPSKAGIRKAAPAATGTARK